MQLVQCLLGSNLQNDILFNQYGASNTLLWKSAAKNIQFLYNKSKIYSMIIILTKNKFACCRCWEILLELKQVETPLLMLKL